MRRFAALITALCGILTGIAVTLPWYYYVNAGDEPPVPMRGIEGEFLGRYTLVLSLVGTVAALVCTVMGPRSKRSLRAWALSALVVLALAMLTTLIDWMGRGISNWRDDQMGVSTDWFGIGVFVTLASTVAGTVAAARLLIEARRSSGEPPAELEVRDRLAAKEASRGGGALDA